MEELIFDILGDLSDELTLYDYHRFLSINELVNELRYKVIRLVEYCYKMKMNMGMLYVVCKYGNIAVLKWFYYNRKCDYEQAWYIRVLGYSEASSEAISVWSERSLKQWLAENEQIEMEQWLNTVESSYMMIEWLYEN